MKALKTAVLIFALLLTLACVRAPTRLIPPPIPANATANLVATMNQTSADVPTRNKSTNGSEARISQADNTTLPTLSQPAENATPKAPLIELPNEPPLIFEKLDYVMRGQFYKLYIYGNGTVISIEETGLRMPVRPPVRTWKQGQIADNSLAQLLILFQSEQFAALDINNKFPGQPIVGGPLPGTAYGDGVFTFSVDSSKLQKTVYAGQYMSPDKGETYPDMPAPLNDIYVMLRTIATALSVIGSENITYQVLGN